MNGVGWVLWGTNWAVGMALVGMTIAVHSGGVVIIMNASRRFWNAPLREGMTHQQRTAIAIMVIVAVAVSLAALHAFESILWAIGYLSMGALTSPADAILYSLDSMTTHGASGLALEPQWRMTGAAESLNGMLLFGISTAFLFAVMQRLLFPVTGSRD